MAVMAEFKEKTVNNSNVLANKKRKKRIHTISPSDARRHHLGKKHTMGPK